MIKKLKIPVIRFFLLALILIGNINTTIVSSNSLFFEKDRNIETPIAKYEKFLQSLEMLEIIKEIPNCIIDIKYATNDNFLGFNFYNNQTKAYIRPECLEMLKKAYQILQSKKPGYSFIIYDAARSIEAQKIMWDNFDKPEYQKAYYVANPYGCGSLHNYGMALDLNIVDSLKNPLDMGTDFDYFGVLAHTYQTKECFINGMLSKKQYENRILLLDIMKEAGFIPANNEWWHYNACTIEEAVKKYKMFILSEV